MNVKAPVSRYKQSRSEKLVLNKKHCSISYSSFTIRASWLLSHHCWCLRTADLKEELTPIHYVGIAMYFLGDTTSSFFMKLWSLWFCWLLFETEKRIKHRSSIKSGHCSTKIENFCESMLLSTTFDSLLQKSLDSSDYVLEFLSHVFCYCFFTWADEPYQQKIDGSAHALSRSNSKKQNQFSQRKEPNSTCASWSGFITKNGSKLNKSENLARLWAYNGDETKLA